MLALPERLRPHQHWQYACRFLLDGAGAAAITEQTELALFLDMRFVLD
jgi:hypothetical protein